MSNILFEACLDTLADKQTQFLCAMLVPERGWEGKSHPFHVLFNFQEVPVLPLPSFLY